MEKALSFGAVGMPKQAVQGNAIFQIVFFPLRISSAAASGVVPLRPAWPFRKQYDAPPPYPGDSTSEESALSLSGQRSACASKEPQSPFRHRIKAYSPQKLPLPVRTARRNTGQGRSDRGSPAFPHPKSGIFRSQRWQDHFAASSGTVPPAVGVRTDFSGSSFSPSV